MWFKMLKMEALTSQSTHQLQSQRAGAPHCTEFSLRNNFFINIILHVTVSSLLSTACLVFPIQSLYFTSKTSLWLKILFKNDQDNTITTRKQITKICLCIKLSNIIVTDIKTIQKLWSITVRTIQYYQHTTLSVLAFIKWRMLQIFW